MNFCPHNALDIQEMLSAIGISSKEELFSDIPPDCLASGFCFPEGKSEFEVFTQLRQLSLERQDLKNSFIGGGFYDHYIPAVVDALAGRSEFYTPYTPYQPECSQGTLQAIFEYQTAIARLTGLDAVNASNYDGGTALAEGIMMALRITRRSRVLFDGRVNPLYLRIARAYLSRLDCSLEIVGGQGDQLELSDYQELFDEKVAAVVFQSPDFFGNIREGSLLVELAHKFGALAVSSHYPISLGLLKTPAELGVDIATGEGQSLGNPLNFGGPYLGFISVKKKHIRALPGRIVGATMDKESRRGFVLTLQAREQHIRRHRATSNICTNQNLCALRSLIYLSALGPKGLEELAVRNYDNAHYLLNLLLTLPGIKKAGGSPFFNEFTIELPIPAQEVCRKMLEQGIAPGLPLDSFYPGRGSELLVAVTEKATKSDLDEYHQTLAQVLPE